jgi:DNA-binding helix-hairpin-helix protein with protein kinase domain
MKTMLTVGDMVELETYHMRCRVESFLGGGGQGEVYQALILGSGPERRFALKWYFPHMATSGQRAILEDLINREAPSPRFIWPRDLASMSSRPGFGYLMPLRDSSYRGLHEIMTGKASPSFRAIVTSAMELADGFWQLHANGLCYRDISFGNVFFEPAHGSVLICDNDNVGIDGRSTASVYGTPGFMAPEVMRGEVLPSAATDLFSLSVLLFYLLMVHHPLQGRRELDEPVWDRAAAYRLYGERPVFIFDPDDRSNEPVPGYHDNALVFWPLYPQFIRDLFVRAFTAGLRDPLNKRVRELEWLPAMVRLRDAIIYCSRCKVEVFADTAAGATPTCWHCGKPVMRPPRLVVDGETVMLNYDTKIFPHHVRSEKWGFDRPVAAVARHPTNADVWGLRNLSSTTWTATTPSGDLVSVLPGRSITLADGTTVDFGTARGVIQF